MIEHETNVEAIDQACRLSPRAGPTGKKLSFKSRSLLTHECGMQNLRALQQLTV
jgi:hypothetical protein